MKTVLVTGAEGFIGSHVVEELVEAGWHVRAMVQYNSRSDRGWLEELPNTITDEVEVIFSDVRDPEGARISAHGVDAIAHLAALISIPHSYDAPASYVQTNVLGTLHMLEAARAHGVSSFVHTSTSEVYGTAQSVPMNEHHRLQAQSPYAASKIGADQLALSFTKSFGMPVTVLRPFNTYGPRQSARALIPTVLTQLLSGLPQIRLGSTHPTRDLTFVSDTARAFRLALERTEGQGNVINVGTGHEVGVLDIVSTASQILNVDVEICTDESRIRPESSEVDRLVCDASLARDLLGWMPRLIGVEGLTEGLKITANWLAQPGHLRLYRPLEYVK